MRWITNAVNQPLSPAAYHGLGRRLCRPCPIRRNDAMPIWLPWLLLAAAEAFKVWVDEQRRS